MGGASTYLDDEGVGGFVGGSLRAARFVPQQSHMIGLAPKPLLLSLCICHRPYQDAPVRPSPRVYHQPRFRKHHMHSIVSSGWLSARARLNT